MKVIKTIKAWQQLRKNIEPNHTVGFVATMGCLHPGHASLIERSKKENNITVLSIFVNPTQFNEQTDLDNYPVTTAADLALAQKLGVDYVFMPEPSAMYPGEHTIVIQAKDEMAMMLEGVKRPGHFDGVLSVVLKLLILISPDKAYFGEKDYQQYILIKKMAEQYFLPCEIIPCAIIREASGLAMSSRNTLLSKKERACADKIATIFANSLDDESTTQHAIESVGGQVEYLAVVNNRRFLAVRVGSIRLIDNRPCS